jgi:hypothetical protein
MGRSSKGPQGWDIDRRVQFKTRYARKIGQSEVKKGEMSSDSAISASRKITTDNAIADMEADDRMERTRLATS